MFKLFMQIKDVWAESPVDLRLNDCNLIVATYKMQVRCLVFIVEEYSEGVAFSNWSVRNKGFRIELKSFLKKCSTLLTIVSLNVFRFSNNILQLCKTAVFNVEVETAGA